MIVITLTKVPASLRGDLTKWCQEIQTGVYVGNVSAKIRDLLWKRIMDNIGNGEATIAYNTNTELGYTFRTTRRDQDVVDLDGITLIKQLNEVPGEIKHGFSNAAKYHQARLKTVKEGRTKNKSENKNFIALDLETTGLDPLSSEIIAVGAVKKVGNDEEIFSRYIKISGNIPHVISKLTGLNDEILQEQGEDLSDVLDDLLVFLSDDTIIGYNLKFDMQFLEGALEKTNKSPLKNRFIDLMPRVKKVELFLDNYRLETVLDKYGIENRSPHNALEDSKATLELAFKLIENGKLRI
ncbi:hypothetical protein FC36_GL001894 [Ligilactobacillus equi DSM 15833 = JCM 10991]|uniref:DNA polymerase III polC-type n=1 Tax=Ligilactobacillus equi DSM 15833 = JCM 10991 TaxID=1423740 RepID=A0A0R1TGW2_9LACO|nr:type I-E CRISPR-associated endoribonuclease Cas2e [Ligilactobacillus equi]KRL76651.1 hypothetical protein FC36_GL001894 [Ligilactobacillus equi DSM 15833 = JCM 10991]